MKILSFLFLALKYLLIIFFLLLVLLILALLLILFVPIKYKIYFSKIKEQHLNLKASWLFSLVSVTYKDEKMTLKIFGQAIKSKSSEEDEEDEEEQEPDFYKTDKQEADKAETFVEEDFIKETSKKTSEKTNKKTSKKDSNIIKDILKFNYKKEFTKDTLLFIINILKQLLPGKSMIWIELGQENPADTGSIIAGLSMLYPFYYSFMNIQGNFEKECFYITIDAKGKITIGKLLYEVFKFITKKSVRRAITYVRKLRKEKKHGREVTN